jgi:hypothetical protein
VDSTDCGLLQIEVEVVMKMKSKCRMLMFDERSRVPSIRISIDFQCVLSCHLSGSRHHFTDQSPYFSVLVSEITERTGAALVSCDALYS